MTRRKKLFIAVVALGVIGVGLYWRQPLAKATMQIVYGLSIRNGLVAHWNFDECDTCTTAADKSGNGNTGTITDANASGLKNRVGGKINNALSFDGVDDYVTIADSNSLDITNNFTIGLWFKPSNLTTESVYFLSKLSDTNNAYAVIWEYVDNQVEFYSSSYSGTDPRTGSGMTISDTNWHHIVYAYDGVTWSGYLDGVRQFSTTRTFSLSATLNTLQMMTFTAASGVECGSGCNANGLLDDVRIYNRALSAGEVKYLADQKGDNTIRSSNKNGLIGYWNFDECDSCTTAADKSGNGNTGTVTDANASGLKNRVGGKINQALSFDGVDDRINVTETASLQITGDITLAAWVNPTSVTDWRTIVLKGTYPNDVYQLTINAGTVFFRNRTTGDNYMNSAGTVSANVWTHVVGVRRGDTLYVYINGQQDATTLAVSGSGANVAGDVSIGAAITGAPFSGFLDDVRIYNRALSADEVVRLYEEGSYRTTINANQNSSFNNGLVGMWSFNGPDVDWGSASAEILDRSGNGNNGDAVSLTKNDARVGIVGQALNFDGTDDGVNLGTNRFSNAQMANGTVGFWFRADVFSGSYSCLFNMEGIVYLCPNNGVMKTQATGVAGEFSVGSALGTATWYHVALTWDGTTARAYIDGAETATQSAGSPNIDGLSRDTFIGISWDGTSFPFDGLVDDVRIYNRALNAAEIQELYLSSARL